LPAPSIDTACVAAATEAFHRTHQQLYTFADPSAPVEFVTLRVRAVGAMHKLSIAELPGVAEGTLARPQGFRRVYFKGSGFVDTPIFRRSELAAGHRIDGPALIEQLDTSTLIFPEQRADVDRFGNLIVQIATTHRS
jgi:N-methylhydantoinase A